MRVLKWVSSAVGMGVLAVATTARAEAPGIYYSWRTLETNVPQCIDRASQALSTQNFQDIRTESNSIAGRTEDTTAVFICFGDATTSATTVMVIVSSEDDETAVTLREALKASF